MRKPLSELISDVIRQMNNIEEWTNPHVTINSTGQRLTHEQQDAADESDRQDNLLSMKVKDALHQCLYDLRKIEQEAKDASEQRVERTP